MAGARHGMCELMHGMAWARHAMCESAFKVMCVDWLKITNVCTAVTLRLNGGSVGKFPMLDYQDLISVELP
jgi:hypothetical protein